MKYNLNKMKQINSQLQHKSIIADIDKDYLLESKALLQKMNIKNFQYFSDRSYEQWSLQTKIKILQSKDNHNNAVSKKKQLPWLKNVQRQQNISWIGCEAHSHYLAFAFILFDRLYSPELNEDQATILKYQIYQLAQKYLSHYEKQYFIQCVHQLQYFQMKYFNKFIRKFRHFQNICIKLFKSAGQRSQSSELALSKLPYQFEAQNNVRVINLRNIAKKMNKIDYKKWQKQQSMLHCDKQLVIIDQNMWNPLSEYDNDFVLNVKIFNQQQMYLIAEKNCIFVYQYKKIVVPKQQSKTIYSQHKKDQNSNIEHDKQYNQNVANFLSEKDTNQMTKLDIELLNQLLDESFCVENMPKNNTQRQTESTQNLDIFLNQQHCELSKNMHNYKQIHGLFGVNPQKCSVSIQVSFQQGNQKFDQNSMKLDKILQNIDFSFGDKTINNKKPRFLHEKIPTNKNIAPIIPQKYANDEYYNKSDLKFVQQNSKIPVFLKARKNDKSPIRVKSKDDLALHSETSVRQKTGNLNSVLSVKELSLRHTLNKNMNIKIFDQKYLANNRSPKNSPRRLIQQQKLIIKKY